MKWMLVLVLAGCGSAPLAPQLVEIPVFTPCVMSMPQRPANPLMQVPRERPPLSATRRRRASP